MSDDRGVAQQEEGLGDQGQERRDRQTQDLPIGLGPQCHRPLPSSNSPNGPAVMTPVEKSPKLWETYPGVARVDIPTGNARVTRM
ncbi:hypothetical protein GCM10009812_02480 [Nocardioides marinus]